MFRCYFCNQVTPPKTTRHTVIIETREKQYSTRRREPKRGRGGFRDRDNAIQDRGGKGVEIMKEVAACPACAAKQHEVKNFVAETVPVEPVETAAVETAAVESAAVESAAVETAAAETEAAEVKPAETQASGE